MFKLHSQTLTSHSGWQHNVLNMKKWTSIEQGNNTNPEFVEEGLELCEHKCPVNGNLGI